MTLACDQVVSAADACCAHGLRMPRYTPPRLVARKVRGRGWHGCRWRQVLVRRTQHEQAHNAPKEPATGGGGANAPVL